MLKGVAKRLKHVWPNSDQTPQVTYYGSRIRKKHVDTSGWASAVRMRAPNMFDTAVQTNKTLPIKHENKRNVLSCLKCLMAFKILSNTIKQHQKRWPSGKMFGHQTTFDAVWSPGPKSSVSLLLFVDRRLGWMNSNKSRQPSIFLLNGIGRMTMKTINKKPRYRRNGTSESDQLYRLGRLGRSLG